MPTAFPQTVGARRAAAADRRQAYLRQLVERGLLARLTTGERTGLLAYLARADPRTLDATGGHAVLGHHCGFSRDVMRRVRRALVAKGFLLELWAANDRPAHRLVIPET